MEFKRSTKIVYRRYAGLFFCVCVDANDNELAYLEAIHFFVEVLDQFFGNVCELDLVFNFYKVRLLCLAGWREQVGGDDSTMLMVLLSRFMLFLTKSSLLVKLKRQASKSC